LIRLLRFPKIPRIREKTRSTSASLQGMRIKMKAMTATHR
jgi:hypothetical protein